MRILILLTLAACASNPVYTYVGNDKYGQPVYKQEMNDDLKRGLTVFSAFLQGMGQGLSR